MSGVLMYVCIRRVKMTRFGANPTSLMRVREKQRNMYSKVQIINKDLYFLHHLQVCHSSYESTALSNFEHYGTQLLQFSVVLTIDAKCGQGRPTIVHVR